MNGGMLIPPGPIRVLVATKPVDFRKGMDGLAALAKEQLKVDPFSGVIFCFRSRLCENSAKFCDWSNRAKFVAIFSLPSGLKARKSEQNRSV